MEERKIIELLKNVDNELAIKKQPLKLIIVGYSAVILSGLANRGTEDLDALENSQSRLLLKHGIHVMPAHFFHFHPDYEKRLLPLNHEKFDCLSPYYLSLQDVFLLKMDAGREKDMQDLLFFIQNGSVSKDDMDKLFLEWNVFWYDGNVEMAELYSSLWGEAR